MLITTGQCRDMPDLPLLDQVRHIILSGLPLSAEDQN